MTVIVYHIHQARLEDAPLLPPIERSAAELFRSDPDLAWIADDKVQCVETHLGFIATGTAWVALGLDDSPVAFLNAEAISGCLHIWEMSVHTDHQRHGLGSKLIAAAKQHALEQGYRALTLTTFRNVAWNESFYARLGFEVIEHEQLPYELKKILANEAEAGLPAERRCAMALHLRK